VISINLKNEFFSIVAKQMSFLFGAIAKIDISAGTLDSS
jgi:hypothetical protein